MPFSQDQLPYLLHALARPQSVGDVVPLPINPGPQAGRPTSDEVAGARKMHVPTIGPIGGYGPGPSFQDRLIAAQRPFTLGPRGY